jgi:HAD superfamily hydrolase (TIGR01490 family)
MGFSDIYAFTKALAEHAVVELHGELKLSILRPSIIESALAEPFPGWLEGFRMAEPIILAFGRGVLRDFPGLPDAVIDIIPVDLVVNAVLIVAASPPEQGVGIYHAASGSRNPLRVRDLYDQAAVYFTAHPLRDRYGQAIGLPDWKWPTRAELTGRGRLALRALEAAQWAVERLPLGAGIAPVSSRLDESRTRLERGLDLAELYGIYTEVDCIFDTRRLMEASERLGPEDRLTFPCDASKFDWSRYFQEVHMPTVVRMARAETGPRAGRQPTGSTAPKHQEAATAVQMIGRRAGRPDVLAVFDVDGTLVETNVVEYFFWMRLKAQRVEEWPAFMARMLREAPRWIFLDRRSRADFQRSFYRQYGGLEVDRMRQLGREALDAVTLRRIYPEGMRRIREHKRAGHKVLLLTGALDVVVEPLAELLEVEVDCAHLLTKDGHLTGDLQSPPPAGEARSTLLEEYAARNQVTLSESFAYADSLSDLPMLELVGTPVAVNPDPRLARVAAQRGWRVERWRMAPGNWRPPVPDPRSAEYREALR